MFPLKIYEILMGYSGQCLQKQPSIGKLQKKGRSSHQSCFIKKGVLRNFTKFTGKHLCQSLFFNKVAGLNCRPKACNFIKKETLAQVFSCEFSKNTFFTEHLQTTASGRVLKKIGTIRGKTSALEFPFFSFSLILKKETPAEVFSSKFFKIFDKSFFKEQFRLLFL